ncbi:MAG: GntR family transcriptional regulator [Paenibacillaceae bacterium]|nr:GntR family transcriptional regulator [Paenibacillaceae bacterium]
MARLLPFFGLLIYDKRKTIPAGRKRSLSHPSLRQQAYEQILAMIESGELAKGGATSEVRLSQKLDMSRTPVRAALQQLEWEGYLRIVSKHGVLILDSSSQRVGDLLDQIAAMALFSVSVAFVARPDALRELSHELTEAFQSVRNASVSDTSELLTFEYDLLRRLILLGNNNEMAKTYQSSISRLFWHRNDGRWFAPYRTRTDEQVGALIRSFGLDAEAYRNALFDYLRTLKMTWR